MNWIEILKLLGTALAPLVQAYAEARKLAKQSGVTDADLAAADARWTKNYVDPLAGQPSPPSPPVEPPPEPTTRPTNYLKKFDPPVPEDPQLMGEAWGFKLGDQVCAESADSKWMVAKKGGSRLGAPLLRVIGG